MWLWHKIDRPIIKNYDKQDSFPHTHGGNEDENADDQEGSQENDKWKTSLRFLR